MKKRSEWPIKESPTNRQQWFFKWVIQFTKSTILLNLGPANKKNLGSTFLDVFAFMVFIFKLISVLCT